MKKLMIAAAFLLSGAASATDMSVEWAVNENPWRTAEEKVRDADRHPAETLAFFGVTPSSTVAEVNPGGGWYSRILAPLVKEKGRYVGLEHNPAVYADAGNYAAGLAKYPEKFAAAKDMYGDKAVAGFIPLRGEAVTAPGSVDVVMVVRAMHNWARRGFMEEALKDVHGLLKSGGVLAVVQHRAAEDAAGDWQETTKQGRWKQSELVKVIESHGFKLEAASEINANPRDKNEYPAGVWALPPNYNGADTDEEKAARDAIGESDRMTLKFVKVG
ncbi:class I SAM-dependent methyltransferase [Gimibacter soli]|uniref:Methyltransferase n=1 Tax=Gimibacter soli TaxID=3024400 RepID=A0AAF0BKW6_9PROT|nr:hypothetical protein [Gimibacter soli]WCL54764.1 hypothetical protein PH603_03195 [Gimibacter soli]